MLPPATPSPRHRPKSSRIVRRSPLWSRKLRQNADNSKKSAGFCSKVAGPGLLPTPSVRRSPGDPRGGIGIRPPGWRPGVCEVGKRAGCRVLRGASHRPRPGGQRRAITGSGDSGLLWVTSSSSLCLPCSLSPWAGRCCCGRVALVACAAAARAATSVLGLERVRSPGPTQERIRPAPRPLRPRLSRVRPVPPRRLSRRSSRSPRRRPGG